jgi:S-formylglutathione hydrolase FrmB
VEGLAQVRRSAPLAREADGRPAGRHPFRERRGLARARRRGVPAARDALRLLRGIALLAALAAFAAPGAAAVAPDGVSYQTFSTRDLPAPARALVFLPPSYARNPGRRYPVLYFLHDAWSAETALSAHGVAAELSRRMADGRMPEFLVVAPGARGSWFSDSHDGKEMWERFLTGDLLRQVESRYRALTTPASRGITGISMGGYGAVKIALRHPGLYGSVSSLSGALIPFGWDDLARYGFFARWTLKRVFGRTRTDNTLDANDVWKILWSSHFDASPFPLYLRGGTEDVYGLGRVAAQFATFCADHGIGASAVLEPGGHDWSYWRRAVLPVFAWHAGRFAYDRR